MNDDERRIAHDEAVEWLREALDMDEEWASLARSIVRIKEQIWTYDDFWLGESLSHPRKVREK